MKKIFLILIVSLGGMSWGQSFSESQQQSEEPTHQFFSEQSEMPPSEPDQGVDMGPGGPGEPPAPIDNWLPLLVLGGIGLGAYFLQRKKKNIA